MTNSAIPVGLVSASKTSARRIRTLLEASGFAVTFDVQAAGIKNRRNRSRVDVVIVAASLKPREASLFSQVRAELPEEVVISVTEPVETPTLRWALEQGADGVVWESHIVEVLCPAVNIARAGQIVFPRGLRRRQNLPMLTNREKQVLSLVIMGLTNRQIAEQLYLSDSTVKSHLNTAYRKLGVGSRSEAAHVITDPDEGLGTGILAITDGGLARGRRGDS